MCGNKLSPCEQLILIVRAPECGPVDVRQIRRFLGVERPESEWDVREMDVHDGTVVDKAIAQKLREDVLSNTKGEGTAMSATNAPIKNPTATANIGCLKRFVRVSLRTKTSRKRADEILRICCRVLNCGPLERNGNRWTFEMVNRPDIETAEVLLLLLCADVTRIDYANTVILKNDNQPDHT